MLQQPQRLNLHPPQSQNDQGSGQQGTYLTWVTFFYCGYTRIYDDGKFTENQPGWVGEHKKELEVCLEFTFPVFPCSRCSRTVLFPSSDWERWALLALRMA